MSRPLKNTIFAVLLAVATATPASAQRPFTSGGEGTIECGRYLQGRENRANGDNIVGWVWGYMTAYNQWSAFPPINDFPADHTVLAYLDKHCRDNPLDRLLQGVVQLVADLGGYRPPPRNKR